MVVLGACCVWYTDKRRTTSTIGQIELKAESCHGRRSLFRPSVNCACFSGVRTIGRGTESITDTRIFSPLTVPRLCDTIGRYWYLFKRLTPVWSSSFSRFEHTDTYSSSKVVAKSDEPLPWNVGIKSMGIEFKRRLNAGVQRRVGRHPETTSRPGVLHERGNLHELDARTNAVETCHALQKRIGKKSFGRIF